jgi:lambda family phage portal protein
MSLYSRAKSAARYVLFGAQKRGFDGARGGRLFADWFASATSADAEIRASFQKLTWRSRDLERNNDYVRAFLLSCERNIIGAARYDLRMDCGELELGQPRNEAPKWVPDKKADSIIETAWEEWGKKGTCTVCGRFSWRDVKRLLVRATPRDGNFIARKVRGRRSGNRFGFALQLWEIDHLDVQKFEKRRDGSEIRFGIEYNANRRPVAYWLMAAHPGDMNSGGYDSLQSTRFDAEEIYHVFLSDRTEQSIGYPWIVSAITRLRQLGMFEEAAVVAARVGASKSGFFKKMPGPNGEVADWEGELNANGAPVMDGSPGTFEGLPPGWELDKWDPAYPNIETGDFRKAMLRGVASSVGMSYNTLGNDLEAVNFSSARVGLFEEREMWKMLQMFYSESFYEPVFGDWLEASIMAGVVPLPLAKFSKFNRPVFKSRRWPFIDPLKEVQAAKEGIGLRITSRRQVIEEGGGDVDEVFHDNKADEKLAESLSLSLSLSPPDPLPEAFGDPSLTVGKKPPVDDEEDATPPPKTKPKG